MPMEEPWQDSPYFLTVFRKDQAPGCRVRPVQLREPLPALAIPLAPPDPDQVINLQAIIDEIYTRSRYARQIDYARPLRPPLTAPEAEWLQQQLHSPR